MMTTYSIVQLDATEKVFRNAIRGDRPYDAQDQRFCKLIDRLHKASTVAEQLQPTDALSASMKWGMQKMIDATTANVMSTRLLKNYRDVFRTLNEMEKRTAKFERILGIPDPYEWREVIYA